MKKILYFVPEFPRLTETFIEREIARLIETGDLEIKVMSLQKASGKTSEKVEAVTEYRRLDWKTSFKAISFFFKNPGGVFAAFRLVLRDGSRNIFARKYLFFKALGYTKIIESYEPDHIHVHFLSDPSTIAMVASKVLGIPFSVSGHALDVFVEGTLIPQKVEHAKFITVCNGYAWQKCVDLAGKADTKKIHKIFHGVDADKIFSGEIKKQKPHRPLIFTAARLVEKKGLRYLIEASRLLKDSGIEHEIRIAGPGPLYGDLISEIERLGLRGTVIIEGDGKGVPFEDISQLYRIADLFVLPSIETRKGDADGVPTVVIEAALARLPIITTAAGGITDLIETDVTGILVPQKESRALAEAIKKVLKDPALAKELGDHAHDRAIGMFDLKQNVGALEKLLAQ